MIDFRVIGLVGASALIAGVLVFELRGGGAPDMSLISPAPRLQPASPNTKPTSAAVEPLLATILARPLLTPSRRPAETGPPAQQSDFSEQRLTGIVVNEDRRVAIFAVSGSKSLAVGEGDEVNGWRVEAITPLEVSVSGPGGMRTLQPRPDTNSRPDPRQANNARPSPTTAPPGQGSAAAHAAAANPSVRRYRE